MQVECLDVVSGVAEFLRLLLVPVGQVDEHALSGGHNHLEGESLFIIIFATMA